MINNIIGSNFMAPRQAPIRVTKFLLTETGQYHEQHRRPYVTNTNAAVINGLQEAVARSAIGNSDPNRKPDTVSKAALAGVANQFLTPGIAVEQSPVYINSGWGTRRYRFMMEVEIPGPMTTVVQLILGYSDQPVDMSMGGNINPDVNFIVNSVITLRTVRNNTPQGVYETRLVGDNSQIMYDPNFQGIGGVHDHLMRPSDIFVNMQRSGMAGLPGLDIHDMRTVAKFSPQKSRRSNNLAVNFVTRTVDAYALSSHDAMGGDHDSIADNCIQQVEESPLSYDSFLSAVAHVQGMSATNCFTLRTLSALDPNCQSNEVMKIFYRGEAQIAHDALTDPLKGMNSLDSAQLYERNRVTQVAVMVANAVAAIMSDLGIMNISFGINNMSDMIGTDVFQPVDVRTFSVMDASPLLQQFQMMFMMQCCRDISFNGQMAYNIQVSCNLVGETRMLLSLDNTPPVPYVVPTFADARFTPVVTADRTHALSVATDFNSMLNTVVQRPSGFNTPYISSNL